MRLRPWCRYYPVELLTLGMLLGLNSLMVIKNLVQQELFAFFVNWVLTAIILVVPQVSVSSGIKWLSVFRDWFILPLILVLYLMSVHLVPLVNPRDLDELFIYLDRILFSGHNPTVLLEAITIPPLTEVLQLVYASFYFLPLILCLLLYLRGEMRSFRIASTVILGGFYVSFIGYFLFPAVGPRFTLQNLQTIPLTGLWAFSYLREILDNFSFLTRDCFPSGHTFVSLLTAALAYRFLSSFFPLSLLWSIVLVISTVYLRYHYVVDVLAGFGLAIAVYLLLPLIERMVDRSIDGKST